MWGFSRLRGRQAAVPAPISVVASEAPFLGNDGPWSTFPIRVGTPPQVINALISTTAWQTWVPLSQGCIQSDPANCSTLRGGLFEPNTSSTWHQNQNIANGLAPLTVESHLNVSGNGLYGYDTLALDGRDSNGPILERQVVVGVATPSFYLGQFGLNPKSTSLPETTASFPNYLSSLNESGTIPSLSWAYTAGNNYRPGPPRGSLTLGGYDNSRFVPNDIIFPFNGTDARSFTVNIGSIVLLTNDLVTIVRTENESISAAIDSTTPYIILPLNVCQQFEEAFGLTWNKNVQGYLVNDTLHETLLSSNASVTWNLGNSSTIPGEGFNISLPYASFNLTASAPLLVNASRYFPLLRAANESQITLGRTFLQEAYLIADYEHNNFTVSQCSWDDHANPQIIAIRRPDDQLGYVSTTTKHHGLSSGAIAGIVIGVLAFLALAVALGFWLRKKFPRTVKEADKEETQDETPELATGNDPYSEMAQKLKNLPTSPEMDGTAIHKGHELDSSPQPGQVFEIDDNRRSMSPMSPISLLSPRSDATRLSLRQQSDPASMSSGGSKFDDQKEVVSPLPDRHELDQTSPVSPEGADNTEKEVAKPS